MSASSREVNKHASMSTINEAGRQLAKMVSKQVSRSALNTNVGKPASRSASR